MTDTEIQAAILRGLATHQEVHSDQLALNVYRSPGWHTAPAVTPNVAELEAIKPRVDAAIEELVAVGKITVAEGIARLKRPT